MANCEVSLGSLPLHIVEDHNDALEHIYRAIGRKKLPFSGSCLVHFDAHPDLLSPENMPSEMVYSKQELFDYLGIADWILPAIYAGHFSNVVWLKPFWSSQIPDGRYELTVGRHKEDGLVKVSLPLNYFLNELLFVPVGELENAQSATLVVLTVVGQSDSVNQQLFEIVRSSKAWILDFDLDFFSTANPFKSMFSEEQFQHMKQLYSSELTGKEQMVALSNPDWASKRQQERRVQLKSLEHQWEADTAIKLSPIAMSVKQLIGTEWNRQVLRSSDIHIAGMMTDLPHHLSTEQELLSLLFAIKHLMKELLSQTTVGYPAMITVARSSEDLYTPPSSVERIQEEVIAVLSEVFPVRLILHRHYQDK